MRLIREQIQGSHPLDYKMHMHNEQLTELVMRAKEWRRYLQESHVKCLDWVEESRPHFGSHKIDEEYEAVMNNLELGHESVSDISGIQFNRNFWLVKPLEFWLHTPQYGCDFP